MMINPVQYAATVIAAGGELASVVCITYDLDSSGEHSAVNFHQVFSSFPQIPIPDDRALTPQEELRILAAHGAILIGGRARERGFLQKRLKEVYGASVEVKIGRAHKPLSSA